jgi:DNA-binding MarR family transcriptional regulator
MASGAQPETRNNRFAEQLDENDAATFQSEGGKGKRGPTAPNMFRLGYLVHDVSRMRRTLCDQHMRPIGITRSQWWVLANLSRQKGEGTSSTELAKILDVGKVTVGGIIDRLETAGYVYRRVDKTDRRAKRIFITHAGFKVIERMREVLEPLNEGICAGLTLAEIDQIEHHLAVIRKNIRGMLIDDDAPGLEELIEG